jgi:hypothetical protein
MMSFAGTRSYIQLIECISWSANSVEELTRVSNVRGDSGNGASTTSHRSRERKLAISMIDTKLDPIPVLPAPAVLLLFVHFISGLSPVLFYSL